MTGGAGESESEAAQQQLGWDERSTAPVRLLLRLHLRSGNTEVQTFSQPSGESEEAEVRLWPLPSWPLRGPDV